MVEFYNTQNSSPHELEGRRAFEIGVFFQDLIYGHHGVLISRELALSLLVVDGQLFDFSLALLTQHGADGFQQRHYDVLEERVPLYI